MNKEYDSRIQKAPDLDITPEEKEYRKLAWMIIIHSHTSQHYNNQPTRDPDMLCTCDNSRTHWTKDCRNKGNPQGYFNRNGQANNSYTSNPAQHKNPGHPTTSATPRAHFDQYSLNTIESTLDSLQHRHATTASLATSFRLP
jgi:hypothetical protein